jgi:hypothetical protein
VNICSYHLQEAGATPVQEVGFALATAVAVLDAVRDSGQVPAERMGDVVGRISFFVNAGVRFVEEMCKMRAFSALWDELTLQRYGVTSASARRFRYGVQVNSLGLTEAGRRTTSGICWRCWRHARDARARAVRCRPGMSAGPRGRDQQRSRASSGPRVRVRLLGIPFEVHMVETRSRWTVPGPNWRRCSSRGVVAAVESPGRAGRRLRAPAAAGQTPVK